MTSVLTVLLAPLLAPCSLDTVWPEGWVECDTLAVKYIPIEKLSQQFFDYILNKYLSNLSCVVVVVLLSTWALFIYFKGISIQAAVTVLTAALTCS